MDAFFLRYRQDRLGQGLRLKLKFKQLPTTVNLSGASLSRRQPFKTSTQITMIVLDLVD